MSPFLALIAHLNWLQVLVILLPKCHLLSDPMATSSVQVTNFSAQQMNSLLPQLPLWSVLHSAAGWAF